MIPLLDPLQNVATEQEDAAALAIRHTGTRLSANESDISLALDVLFAPLHNTITDTAAKQ